MSRYGDNIRRIANVKDTKDPSHNKVDGKSNLDAGRGVAYYDPNGILRSTASTPNTGIPNEAIESAVQKSVTDALAEARAAVEDEDGKPAGTSGDSNQTPLDVGNLIDGEYDASFGEDSAINILDGMTDPYYGDELVVRMDGSHAPPNITNGEGYPTEGALFDNSFSDGTYEGWQLGYYWAGGGASEATPAMSFAAQIALNRTNFPLPYPAGYGDAYWLPSTLVGSGGTPPTQYRATMYQGVGGTPYTGTVIRTSCTPGAFSYCPLTEPVATEWPGNYTTNLSLVAEGLFKSNTYDFSRLGTAYKDGVSTLVFKFDGGARWGVIEPGIDGSKMIYEVDSGGNAIGTIRRYRPAKISYESMAGFTGTSITRPYKLLDVFPAASIANYRPVGSNTSFIRLGGIPIK